MRGVDDKVHLLYLSIIQVSFIWAFWLLDHFLAMLANPAKFLQC